jgi:hypothetical protein
LFSLWQSLAIIGNHWQSLLALPFAIKHSLFISSFLTSSHQATAAAHVGAGGGRELTKHSLFIPS